MQYQTLVDQARSVRLAVRTWCIARLPTASFWDGAASALAVGGWVILAASLAGMAASAFSWVGLAGLFVAALLAVLLASLVIPASWLVIRMSRRIRWGLALLFTASILVTGGSAAAIAVTIIWLTVSLVLLGGGLARLRAGSRNWQTILPTVAGGVALCLLAVAMGLRSWPGEESIVWSPIQSDSLTLDAPGLPGTFTFDYRTYGSGSDPRRPEFGAGVDHVSQSVDGTKLLDRWSGAAGWARTLYWGVDPESLPIQGRAWVPKGSGPFPIVLIVHGNHSMEDFSDVGYGYLGELLASRGAIAVSVDQNFLNSGWSNLLGMPDPGLDEENDARGWMLLQHLTQWRVWNADPAHEFGGRVDLDNVVLIGHSRGGEAVSEAAVFNRLSVYPDDATLELDFDFGLRGIVAIAPVDSQYNPREQATHVVDVSYLVLHGSHDGDVTSYAGSSTYSRVSFGKCLTCFKAGVYLIGANHGQFNTAWGDSDMSLPMSSRLDRAHLMSGVDQRAAARTLIGAFVAATVQGRAEYRAFLAQPDRAHALLPEGTRYLSQYLDARETVIANFEEDADARTGTLAGTVISAEGLELWHEREIALKWNTADTAAAVVGWAPGPDHSNPPSYTIRWPSIPTTPNTTISLALAPATEPPGETEDYDPPDATNFTLDLIDARGTSGSLQLNTRRPLVKRIEPVVFKLHGLQQKRSEAVFQRYRFSIAEWLAVQPELDASAISGIRLVFDQTAASTIIIDDITLSPDGF